MKTRTFLAVNLALAATVSSLCAAEAMKRFDARPGSKMRIEGTSNIHDWQTESRLIGGYIDAGDNFPTEPGQEVKPGPAQAKVEVYIPIRSFNSLEKDGRPYSTKMDDRMYEAMKQPTNPRVLYHLTDLTVKEVAKSKDAPYVLEAKGQLAVAGATNTITMPINVLPLGNDKLKISGTTKLKMTDFKIQPPAPAIALGMIKTGDEVKLLFEWTVEHRTKTAAVEPAK